MVKAKSSSTKAKLSSASKKNGTSKKEAIKSGKKAKSTEALADEIDGDLNEIEDILEKNDSEDEDVEPVVDIAESSDEAEEAEDADEAAEEESDNNAENDENEFEDEQGNISAPAPNTSVSEGSADKVNFDELNLRPHAKGHWRNGIHQDDLRAGQDDPAFACRPRRAWCRQDWFW